MNLSEELTRAVAERPGAPLRLTDPATNREYVLLPADVYDRLKALDYDDSPWTDEEMELLAWEAGKAIPWVKVNTLPRFVRFNHEAHALARVDCDRCHGDVARMDRIERVAPLTMGWCVQCHQDQHAPDDCLTCHY